MEDYAWLCIIASHKRRLHHAEEEDQLGGTYAGSVATLLARDEVALFAGQMEARKVHGGGVPQGLQVGVDLARLSWLS